jgi:hypothetical protein
MKKQLIGAGIALTTVMAIPMVALAQTSIRDTQAANSTTFSGEIVSISGED